MKRRGSVVSKCRRGHRKADGICTSECLCWYFILEGPRVNGKRRRLWSGSYATQEETTKALEVELRRRETGVSLRGGRLTLVDPTLGPVVVLPRGPLALVYRCFNLDGELLYIGKTARGMKRTMNHAEKGWFEREVAFMTFERVPLDEAIEAEARAIQRERPRYNVIHNNPRRSGQEEALF